MSGLTEQLIADHYSEKATAASLASYITRMTGMKVTRNMIMSFYKRHPEFNLTYPLRRGDRHYKPLPDTEPLVAIVGFTLAEAAEYDNAAPGVAVGETGCKWPVRRDESGHWLFCGHDRRPGGSYCRHHFIRSRGVHNDPQ